MGCPWGWLVMSLALTNAHRSILIEAGGHLNSSRSRHEVHLGLPYCNEAVLGEEGRGQTIAVSLMERPTPF